MPAGVPVLTMAIGVAGAKNAAISALSILGINDEKYADKYEQFKKRTRKNSIGRDETMIKTILPGKTIGIIGGGQLGRMLAMSAKRDGLQNCCLDQVIAVVPKFLAIFLFKRSSMISQVLKSYVQ